MPRDVEAEIADEIIDHLSLAARDLQVAGHAADEAGRLARQKFGDVAAIGRRMWWIQKGDEVMLRIAFAIVLVLLILAVAGLGIGGWRMSKTIDDFGDTLAAMNETQKSLLDTQQRQNQPAEIQGICYLGQRDRPAQGADVAIYELPEMKVVRRVVTNAEGRFRSGFLPTGEYLVLTPLIGDANPLFPFSSDESNLATDGPVYRMQSAPLTVYPGMRSAQLDLNVQMIEVGQLSFELAGAVPDWVTGPSPGPGTDRPRYQIHLSVNAGLEPAPLTLPINPLTSPATHSWPLVGVYRHSIAWFMHNPSSFTDQPVLFSEFAPMLPAKQHKLSVQLNATTSSLPNRSAGFGGAFGSGGGAFGGGGYGGSVGGYGAMSFTIAKASTEVEIKPGERTHVRIIPTEQLQETYEELIKTYVDAFEKKDLVAEKQALAELQRSRPAKLEIIGHFPLKPQSEDAAKQ
jgi:hypothetical protein